MFDTKVKLSIICFTTCIFILVILVQTKAELGIKLTNAKLDVADAIRLRVVRRDSWLAQQTSAPPQSLHLPVARVLVTSTETENCTTQAACTFRVRSIQTYNIESLQHDDIIYNFLIGGDGSVYEGRGWDHMGAHLKGYNENSISFAYIGTFKHQKPTAKQMNATRLLLEEGLQLGKLSRDFKITCTHELNDSFKNFSNWSEK